MSFSTTGAMITGLLLLASQATASVTTLEQANDCATIVSRLERLYCYDALFASGKAPANSPSRPAQWYAVQALEQERGSGFSFRLREQNNGDVLMSAPALATLPPRPRLVISCTDNITRFQLHTDAPLDAKRTELSLITPIETQKQTWRIRADGYVIAGGRGLPAIGTLRQLLHADTLTLASSVARLDGLRFDLSEFHSKIQPLREACHW